MMAAKSDNPLGFWEHEELGWLNDEILTVLGGTWDEPPALAPGWQDDEALEPLYRQARDLVERDFRGAERWAFKDPRSSLLVPFWRRVLPDAAYLVCLRHPLDAATSLERRNGFSMRKATRLWARYTAAALESTADLPRLLTRFERYFEDPLGELVRLRDWLGLSPEAGRGARRGRRDVGARSPASSPHRRSRHARAAASGRHRPLELCALRGARAGRRGSQPRSALALPAAARRGRVADRARRAAARRTAEPGHFGRHGAGDGALRQGCRATAAGSATRRSQPRPPTSSRSNPTSALRRRRSSCCRPRSKRARQRPRPKRAGSDRRSCSTIVGAAGSSTSSVARSRRTPRCAARRAGGCSIAIAACAPGCSLRGDGSNGSIVRRSIACSGAPGTACRSRGPASRPRVRFPWRSSSGLTPGAPRLICTATPARRTRIARRSAWLRSSSIRRRAGRTTPRSLRSSSRYRTGIGAPCSSSASTASGATRAIRTSACACSTRAPPTARASCCSSEAARST